jgi:hypothetical protein
MVVMVIVIVVVLSHGGNLAEGAGVAYLMVTTSCACNNCQNEIAFWEDSKHLRSGMIAALASATLKL